MQRIYMEQLEAVVKRINDITSSPDKPYSQVDGKHVSNPGNFHITGAYGGYQLARMTTTSGCDTDVLGTGYVTKRVLYEAMHIFIKGINTGKECA